MRRLLALLLLLPLLALGQVTTTPGATGVVVYPTNVAITGGSINGTTIGASSSTTGKFSTVQTTGSIGMGTAPDARFSIWNNISPVGTDVAMFYITPTVAAATTSSYATFSSNPTFAASATPTFTTHYNAVDPVLGSGASTTYQQGFSAGPFTAGTGTNYGFRGQVATTAVGAYNLYLDGTAPNYIVGHIHGPASGLAMGACGTNPSVVGGDTAMLITVGTGGAATTCAVTFALTWANAPVCIAQNNTDRVAYSMATDATTLTITATAAFTAGSKFHVHCIGY